MKTGLELAIERAIFKGDWTPPTIYKEHHEQYYFWLMWCVMQPLFWQSLGRAEGWYEKKYGNTYFQRRQAFQWEINWHRFIDHLTSDGDINKFFDSLLKK